MTAPYDWESDAKGSWELAVATKREQHLVDTIPGVKRARVIGRCELLEGDCREIMPHLERVDAVVTDPPYPDWLVDKYKYFDGIIDGLTKLKCRQLIFWSTKSAFPLDYTARHVWDKKTGFGSEYEFIFERNGNANFKVVREYLINSDVAARFTGDVWTGHKSQKPIKLMQWCLCFLPNADTILDPFMGSGTTLVACAKLGRRGIGIELDPDYFDIAVRRVEEAYKQPDFFVDQPKPEPQQEGFEW